MKENQHYTIFDGTSVMQAAFTMDTTDTVTSNAHGLKNGDVLVFTTATTLPAGLSLATEYYVRDVATNTFKISLIANGPVITSTDAGTGTHTFHLQGRRIYTGDADFISITSFGNATANMTLNIVGSTDRDCPIFGAALSATNTYDNIASIDIEDAGALPGDEGYTPGASAVRNLSLNVDGINWVTVKVTWTAGNATIKAVLYNKR